MNSDTATVVYSYTFVGIALGSGLLWVGKRWVKHLTTAILDQVLEAIKPIQQLERNGGSSLADRVDRIETRQNEMMDLFSKRRICITFQVREWRNLFTLKSEAPVSEETPAELF